MSIPHAEQPGDITLSPQGATWRVEVHTMSGRYLVWRYVPTAQLLTALEAILERRWEDFKSAYPERPLGGSGEVDPTRATRWHTTKDRIELEASESPHAPHQALPQALPTEETDDEQTPSRPH